MSTIWQTANRNRDNLRKDIFSLLEAAAVTDWLGSAEAPVILKPNLVVSRPASEGATTHPEIVAAVIEYLLESGFSRITIAEGSWVGDSTGRAFKKCGYTGLSKRYGISLTDLQKDDFIAVETADGIYKLCRSISELEKEGGSLINIPVLKGHGQTLLTCALKNLKGCIPDSEKRRYHSLGVHSPVARLNTLIKPAFSLVDGLNGDPGWEEGGSPEKRDILLLGRDSVSIDTHACRLLNIPPADVSYIALAEEYGAGTTDADVVHLGENTGNDGFRGAETAAEAREWINKVTDQRSACSACFGNLASALRELSELQPEAAAVLGGQLICIGRDFRGEALPQGKTGIGVCTGGLKGCPPSRQAILDFLITGIRASG